MKTVLITPDLNDFSSTLYHFNNMSFIQVMYSVFLLLESSNDVVFKILFPTAFLYNISHYIMLKIHLQVERIM